MFTVFSAFRNVIRHKRRGIISCVLLFVCLSVITGALFSENYYDRYIAEVTEEYSRKVKVQFRDDLQFWGKSLDMDHVIKSEYKYEKTEEEHEAEIARMEQYRHPYSFTREMFERLSEFSEVAESSLVYLDYVYRYDGDVKRFTEMMGAMMAEVNTVRTAEGDKKIDENPIKLSYSGVCHPFCVIGGDMTEFCEFISEEYFKFRWKWGMLEGTEPGSGECVITKYAAEELGKQVGDPFELYDSSGNQIGTLKISGIMQIYAAEQLDSEKVHLIVNRPAALNGTLFGFDRIPSYGTPYGRGISDEITDGIKAANPGYGIGGQSLLYLLHTDFDTAYSLYDGEDFEEHHQFNNYMASYRLTSGEHKEAFTEYLQENMGSGYDEEFEARSYDRTIHKKTEAPGHVYHSFGTLIRYGTAFFFIILLIVVLVNIRERGYEIGILYASGVSSGRILFQFGAENGIIAGTAALLSAFGGVIGVKAGELNYYFLAHEQLSYRVPPEWVLVFLATVCAAFLVSAGITTVYLLVNNPAKILRER